MKILILAALALCVTLTTGCAAFPIKGNLTYETPSGSISVGSTGKAIVIDGRYRGQK